MEPTTQAEPQHLSRIEKLREEKKALKFAVQDRMAGSIIGAFGLIAGLAWNDAVKSLIDYIYPAGQLGGILPKFVYALIVTVLVAVFIYAISKWLSPKKPA